MLSPVVTYWQGGVELPMRVLGNGTLRPVPLLSERFYPVVQYTGSQTIAEWLIEQYSASQALLREVASGMSIAEIGGYWFFDDGSELSV